LAVFVVVQGRLTLNDPELYTRPLSLGNLGFSLGLGCLVFAPWLFSRLTATADFCRRRPDAAAAAVLTTAVSSAMFTVTDWRNDFAQSPQLIRNFLVHFILQERFGRVALCLTATWFALAISAEPWPPGIRPLIVGSWFLGLLPLEFVEPRYYLTTYALVVLFRRPQSWAWETAYAAYWLAGGLALHWVHLHSRYFL
jgi:hypothetical protein